MRWDCWGALPVSFNPNHSGRELTGSRITAILTAARWSYGQTIPTGQSFCDNVDEPFNGSTAEIVQRTALSDPGLVVAQPSLTAPIEFLPRGYRPSRTLQISDRPGTPGVRFHRRPTPESAQDQMVNQVSYTLPSNSTPQLFQDADSVAAYGTRRIDRHYELTSSESLAVARSTINTNKDPITMPRQAVVALHLEPEERAALAALTNIGDLAEMVSTDTDGSIVASAGLVDGVGIRIAPLGNQLTVEKRFYLIPTFGASVPQPAKLPGLPDVTALAGSDWQLFLPPATGGSGDGFTYAVSGRPSWMRWDATRRRLYGTPPFTGGPWTIRYTATDRTDTSRTATGTFAVSIEVAALVLPVAGPFTFNTGAIVSRVLPAASGGSGNFTYSLSSRPTWLNFNASTRTMSGNAPRSAQAADQMTYGVRDTTTGQSATNTVTVTVSERPVTMPAITNQSIAAGTAWSRTMPAASGGSGAGFDYALVGKPSWITVSGRTLSGTPPWRDSATALNWRATDRGSAQQTQQPWTLTVTVPALVLPAQSGVTVAAGGTLALNLPLASGGSGSYTYTLSDRPSWVTRNGNRLTGTAPTTASTENLTWTVRDTNTGRQVARQFALRVAVNPVTLPAIGNALLGGGDSLAITLPVAAGGSGSYTYALTGKPSWATLTGHSLTGTAPYADATINMTWAATDDVTGIVTRSAFTVTVELAALAMAAIANVSRASGSSFSITLPVATNGSGNYTYALTGKPSWATLNGRVLSGTAPYQSALSDTLTWTATDDASSATVSRNFNVATTLRTDLGAPVVSAVSTSTTEVRVTWPAIANASGNATIYELRSKLHSGSDWGAWGAATSPHDLSGLTRNTGYDIEVRALATGYQRSTGSAQIVTTGYVFGQHLPAFDVALPSGAFNFVVADGSTFWAVGLDVTGYVARAYDVGSGSTSRNASKDFRPTNQLGGFGFVENGILYGGGFRRNPSRGDWRGYEIASPNAQTDGVIEDWSTNFPFGNRPMVKAGSAVWIQALRKSKHFAYTFNASGNWRPDTSKDFDGPQATSGNPNGGLATDGTTIWVIQRNRLRAYRVSDQSRDSSKDIDLSGSVHDTWRGAAVVGNLLFIIWQESGEPFAVRAYWIGS